MATGAMDGDAQAFINAGAQGTSQIVGGYNSDAGALVQNVGGQLAVGGN